METSSRLTVSVDAPFADRQLEDGASATTGAVGEQHGAAPLADELARDSEPETGARQARAARAAAVEALEHRPFFTDLDARSLVEDLHPTGPCNDGDGRARRRVADRVLDQGVESTVEVGPGAPRRRRAVLGGVHEF